MARTVFPTMPRARGMYESLYLRAVSPEEPVGAWIRYTVHKRPGGAPKGSVWCTIFDARRDRPFMHKYTSASLSVPAGGWIAIDASHIGPGLAEGESGPARWSLRFQAKAAELRHLGREWLYRTPLPHTKLTSPCPSAVFAGTIELPDRTLDTDGWQGMVGHNWGSEHAARWVWLHGVGFEQDPEAWIDIALGRVLIAGRMTPWLAGGAVSLEGRRLPLGGIAARGTHVAESPQRCTVCVRGRDGLVVQARVDVPPDTTAGWRYADPDGADHDVVNCSIARLTLNVHPRGQAATVLVSGHGGAYELGMAERDHGVPLAPFPDG